jgi:hypothetical protein
MEERANNDGSDAMGCAYLVIGAFALYALVYIVSMIGVIITILLTAGAGYLGVQTALNTQLWQDRRIARQQQLEAERQKHLDYHTESGREWMANVVENYYDDKLRDEYQDKDRFGEAVKIVRKVKEVFK